MFKDNIQKISTGSYDLNKWLFGGYEKNIITMIAGPAGSGKTNFVLLAACSQARKGNKVIFIDTEGGFSVDRIKQIAGDSFEDILKNISLLEPTSFEEQKKALCSLLKNIKKQNIGLIIIDGMSMLYRLELGDAVKENDSLKIRQVNKDMAEQMKILSEISRKQKIPVLITNQVYFSFIPEEEWRKGAKPEMKIVGGDLFKYWSKCIIKLENEKGRRKAVLFKHRSLPTKEMVFEIKNKGIFRKRWI